jgi:hypothetical protein
MRARINCLTSSSDKPQIQVGCLGGRDDMVNLSWLWDQLREPGRGGRDSLLIQFSHVGPIGLHGSIVDFTSVDFTSVDFTCSVQEQSSRSCTSFWTDQGA